MIWPIDDITLARFRRGDISEMVVEPEPPSIVCPRCGMRSYNPNDIRERYCGRCHEFHDETAGP